MVFFLSVCDSFSLVKQRLWFKTNLKLCKIWFDMGEYGRMSKVSFFKYLRNIDFSDLYCYLWELCVTNNQILKELHKSCQREDGTDDQKKGSQLLEVYAIEIQMYTETKNNKKLKVRISLRCMCIHICNAWQYFLSCARFKIFQMLGCALVLCRCCVIYVWYMLTHEFVHVNLGALWNCITFYFFLSMIKPWW